MKKFICVMLVLSVISCASKEEKIKISEVDNLTAQQIDSVLTEFKFEYDNPVFIDSSEHVLLPMTTQLLAKNRGSRSDYYGENTRPRCWNILFYNSSNGETRLLTENQLLISDYSVNLRNSGDLLTRSILYRIADQDYNSDEKLDAKDPDHLFISNQDGSGLRRLSPINEALESFTIIPHSNQLIIRTKRDINGDLKFNHKDEAIWYKIDLDGNSEPIEMVNELNKEKIKALYFEQWVKK